jgi:hypothetical protein
MMGKRRSGTGAILDHVRPMGPRAGAGHDQKVSAMIHPSDHEISHAGAVRDGQSAPVTCAACGCRLTQAGDAWFHFNPLAGRDARGCRIACADAAHDASGRAVSLAV